MGRDSRFERIAADKYYTPYEAVIPLLPHLTPSTRFIEPCAGDGRLAKHLERHGHRCAYACDILPDADWIEKQDVLMFDSPLPLCDMIITNPPWLRDPLHQMIEKFSNHAPTWLLFDAAWAYTKQAAPYAALCRKIVSVGRVQWIEDSKDGGKKDAAWYLFVRGNWKTEFYFR